ncbi:MAG: hypothetical protein IPI67_19500 [Myxococcales bacterium]|nr:hypothetical protein [Myxococcales bacterium]
MKADDPSNLPANELLQSPLVQQLRQRYEDAVRERASFVGIGKGEGHPDVASADARANATRVGLLAEVKNVQRATDRELSAVGRQEAGLSGLFEAAKRRALDLNLLEVDYNRLRRSRDNSEKLYGMLLERTKESDLARMMQVNNIRVVDRPTQPRSPIASCSDQHRSGYFSGIALGIGAAMARALPRSDPQDSGRRGNELGLVFLGLLPEIGTGGTGTYYSTRRRRKQKVEVTTPELIVHNSPNSGVAEAARAIRTNLMFMAPDEPYHTLLVTSPAPSEGKTTVAVCIAGNGAGWATRRAHRLRSAEPRVHRVFGKKSTLGVTSALVDGASIQTIAQQTEVPNLWVIPAGCRRTRRSCSTASVSRLSSATCRRNSTGHHR